MAELQQITGQDKSNIVRLALRALLREQKQLNTR